MRFKATSSGMKIPVEVTRRITNETTWARLRAPTRAFRLRITRSCPAGRKSRSSCTTTSYITGEWNTRRIKVMSSSTKGKNESRALAATENANVCTSVRNKYFTVELTTPEYDPSAGAGEAGRAEAAEAVELDCWS